MNHLTTVEAARLKNCTKQAIVDAIADEKIDAERFGRAWMIKNNKKFQQWNPKPYRDRLAKSA